MNDGGSKSNQSNVPTERPALPAIKPTINIDELQNQEANDGPESKVQRKKKRSPAKRKQSYMGKTMRDMVPPHAKDEHAKILKKERNA